MDTPTQETAIEAGKVLDALVALSLDLSCHCEHPPDRLVLSAAKVQETCDAIKDAVSSLKKILEISEANGAEVISASMLKKLGESRES